jgi:hypothetical protein
MLPVPAAVEKNTKNAAVKTYKKKTSSNISLPDVFRRGEKIVFRTLFFELSATTQQHFN